jgi:hypothetical protein
VKPVTQAAETVDVDVVETVTEPVVEVVTVAVEEEPATPRRGWWQRTFGE